MERRYWWFEASVRMTRFSPNFSWFLPPLRVSWSWNQDDSLLGIMKKIERLLHAHRIRWATHSCIADFYVCPSYEEIHFIYNTCRKSIHVEKAICWLPSEDWSSRRWSCGRCWWNVVPHSDRAFLSHSSTSGNNTWKHTSDLNFVAENFLIRFSALCEMNATCLLRSLC